MKLRENMYVLKGPFCDFVFHLRQKYIKHMADIHLGATRPDLPYYKIQGLAKGEKEQKLRAILKVSSYLNCPRIEKKMSTSPTRPRFSDKIFR